MCMQPNADDPVDMDRDARKWGFRDGWPGSSGEISSPESQSREGGEGSSRSSGVTFPESLPGNRGCRFVRTGPDACDVVISGDPGIDRI